jgi:hypothetical protein
MSTSWKIYTGRQPFYAEDQQCSHTVRKSSSSSRMRGLEDTGRGLLDATRLLPLFGEEEEGKS